MLVKFKWDEMYSVGINEMDSQHKRFFEIANMIVDYCNSNSEDKDELDILLSNLVGYSIYHLDFEERHFIKFNYEDRLSHTDEHRNYRIQVQKFVDESEKDVSDKKEIASKAAEFASKWLQNHILIDDKKYTDFFKKYPIEEKDDYKLLI